MLGIKETIPVGSAIGNDTVGKFDGLDGVPCVIGAQETATDVRYGTVAYGNRFYIAVCEVHKIIIVGDDIQSVENDTAIGLAGITVSESPRECNLGTGRSF